MTRSTHSQNSPLSLVVVSPSRLKLKSGLYNLKVIRFLRFSRSESDTEALLTQFRRLVDSVPAQESWRPPGGLREAPPSGLQRGP